MLENYLRQLVNVCRARGYEIRDAAIYEGNEPVAIHVFVNAAAAGYEDVQTHEIKTVNLRDEK